jgi:centrosomin
MVDQSVDFLPVFFQKKLLRTRRALEETFLKLKLSNQKKEQVEKDIRQQILKTQNVLKNVRHNMENELEKKNSS